MSFHLPITLIEGLEYRHQGDLGVAGREAFDYLPPHILLPRHHLYACYPDQPQLKGSLAFRDFLRNHKAFRKRLSDLKIDLDNNHNSNRQMYMQGKRELVEHIIQIALKKQATMDLGRTRASRKPSVAKAPSVPQA